MANIQKIVLQYEADLSKLRKDYDRLEKEMKDVQRASKQSQQSAQKEIDKTSSKMKSFNGILKNVAAGMLAAFSVRAIINFTKKAVELSDIQQRAEAKLLQALRGREDIQKRLLKQASDLQRVTLFGDEVTIEAAAQLAQQLGVNEEAISRLLPVVQDLATGLNMDLVAAAQLVGKTLGSSTNALSRYGIEITGAVGSTERLETAVTAITEKFGGQAEAATVGAGALKQFNNAWGDFMEQVGETILPTLSSLATSMTDMLGLLEGFNRVGGIMNTTTGPNWVSWLLQVDAAQKAIIDERSFEAVVSMNISQLSQQVTLANKVFGDHETAIENVTDVYESFRAGIINSLQTDEQKLSAIARLDAAWERLVNPIEATTEEIKRQGEEVYKILDGFEELMLILRLQDVDAAQKEFIETIDTLITNSEEAGAKIGDIEERNQNAYKQTAKTAKEAQEEEREQIALTVQARADAAAAIFSAAQSIGNDLGALLGEQAEKSKGLAVFNILLEQAQALARAISQAFALPPPFNFLAAASAVASVTAAFKQVDSIISGAETPKFAEGVIDLHGKGGPKSDAIPALLSRGESVMTAAETSEHKALLQSIRTGNYDEYIAKNHVKPILNSFAENLAATLPLYDDYGIIRAVRGNKTINLSNQTIKKLRQPKQRFH